LRMFWGPADHRQDNNNTHSDHLLAKKGTKIRKTLDEHSNNHLTVVGVAWKRVCSGQDTGWCAPSSHPNTIAPRFRRPNRRWAATPTDTTCDKRASQCMPRFMSATSAAHTPPHNAHIMCGRTQAHAPHKNFPPSIGHHHPRPSPPPPPLPPPPHPACSVRSSQSRHMKNRSCRSRPDLEPLTSSPIANVLFLSHSHPPSIPSIVVSLVSRVPPPHSRCSCRHIHLSCSRNSKPT
jgi:hypothetical protein